jgi:hypothetical protein
MGRGGRERGGVTMHERDGERYWIERGRYMEGGRGGKRDKESEREGGWEEVGEREGRG